VSDDLEVFSSVLEALEDVGILSDVIIIGGWAQYLYRHHFNEPPEFSALRTLDIDILFGRPPAIRPSGDLEESLKARGFERDYTADGSTKFVSREAEIEFLIPDKGSGDEEPYQIKELSIRAQSLRLVDILTVDPIQVRYGRYRVNVPDPIRFFFNKLLVSKQRRSEAKREKDLQTGDEIATFLARTPKWKGLIPLRFDELSKKQRAVVLPMLLELKNPAAALIVERSATLRK
jgi:hypothetical protein